MTVVAAFAAIALTLLAVAGICYRVLSPRVRRGQLSHGRASASALLVLLMTPGLAAVVVAASFTTTASGLLFYAAYAMGLACFIVINRRLRDLARDSG